MSIDRSNPTVTEYVLEDGTSLGRINGRHYGSGSERDEPEDCGMSQLYVHIVGTLRTTQKLEYKNAIQITHVRKVTDLPNQLFFHILEAAFVSLRFERGPPVRSF